MNIRWLFYTMSCRVSCVGILFLLGLVAGGPSEAAVQSYGDRDYVDTGCFGNSPPRIP